jgi:hypothetical protein
MINETIQQEILLVTTSTFSKRQFCENNTVESARFLSPAEQLEEACWNGLLDELLPEILQKATCGKHLYLWHIRNGASFLQIELSELPLSMDKRFSIDTNFFLPTILFN